MCIIIKREDPELPQYRIDYSILNRYSRPLRDIVRRQDGFTLTEMLVSLCIMGIVMHGVWQWATVMYRTSDTMAQNYQAVYLAQQVFAGLSVHCPDEWEIRVESVREDRLLYETTVQITSNRRQWHFYYVGPEEIEYEANKNSS